MGRSRIALAWAWAAISLSDGRFATAQVEPTPAVLLVSIDGLRRDMSTTGHMPFLARMADEGAYAYDARSLEPTFTIPNHTSLVNGLTPKTHGIHAIGDPGDIILENTIFDVARRAGLTTGLYLSKTKLRHLAAEESVSKLMITSVGHSNLIVEGLVADVEERGTPWDLTLLHLTEPDQVGHVRQWLSEEYFDALQISDILLERVVESFRAVDPGRPLYVIVSSDHGGEGFNHGDAASPSTYEIPWICTGPGIQEFTSIERRVGNHDSASTALWLLGLEIPKSFEGTAVTGILEGGGRSFVRGDANADGEVNLSDSVMILQYLFVGGLRIRCPDAADTTDAGVLTITSGIYLLRYLFLGGPAPTDPFGVCGSDPTEDSLSCGGFPPCI
ncbi:MAG: alkaline phosphatase family protein [Planctomycetota bacterium]